MRNIALAVALFIAILIISFSSWRSGFKQGYDRGYAEGVEGGKGQLKNAMAGEVYELKLVGAKDDQVYELEGSYGLAVNGQPDCKRIPFDAKTGDHVACIRHEKGLEIVSRRP